MSKGKTLEARRTSFRPSGESFVRITSDGCVQDTDMHMLKPVETYQVDVCGEIKTKRFQRLSLNDREYLADVVTGTLYAAHSGMSGSAQMRILKTEENTN